jgi:putative SOS response-associated peptidase YedK
MIMCGRFTIRVPMNLILKHFAIGHSDLQLALRYNVAPTQQVPVVRQVDAQRELTTMRWGLVPSWADDPKIGYKLINARSEEAAKKPSFRSAMKSRRCLIPADGFFEWRAEGKKKFPMWFRRKDEQPFAFAGLWECWSKVEPALESCTILTTSANELVSDYHNRMPVVLAPNDYDAWLNPEVTDATTLEYLMAPFPADEMKATAVNPIVNNARHDAPDCIEAFQAA